jgi:hypothetical protein
VQRSRQPRYQLGERVRAREGFGRGFLSFVLFAFLACMLGVLLALYLLFANLVVFPFCYLFAASTKGAYKASWRCAHVAGFFIWVLELTRELCTDFKSAVVLEI